MKKHTIVNVVLVCLLILIIIIGELLRSQRTAPETPLPPEPPTETKEVLQKEPIGIEITPPAGSISAVETTASVPECLVYTDKRAVILDAVNIERSERNLPKLCRNLKLDVAAAAKANAMIAKEFFAHTDPDGNFFSSYITDAGYVFNVAGENLSINFTPTEAVAAWFDSPTHYENIIKSEYTETGIWIEGPYIVHLFAKPR